MTISVSFQAVKGITNLSLAGRLLGNEELEMVVKEVEDNFAGQENVKLIIDLSRVEYTGSQGISMLVALSRKYRIKLAAPQPSVRNTLNLLNINKILEIYETLDEAIKGFTG